MVEDLQRRLRRVEAQLRDEWKTHESRVQALTASLDAVDDHVAEMASTTAIVDRLLCPVGESPHASTRLNTALSALRSCDTRAKQWEARCVALSVIRSLLGHSTTVDACCATHNWLGAAIAWEQSMELLKRTPWHEDPARGPRVARLLLELSHAHRSMLRGNLRSAWRKHVSVSQGCIRVAPEAPIDEPNAGQRDSGDDVTLGTTTATVTKWNDVRDAIFVMREHEDPLTWLGDQLCDRVLPTVLESTEDAAETEEPLCLAWARPATATSGMVTELRVVESRLQRCGQLWQWIRQCFGGPRSGDMVMGVLGPLIGDRLCSLIVSKLFQAYVPSAAALVTQRQEELLGLVDNVCAQWTHSLGLPSSQLYVLRHWVSQFPSHYARQCTQSLLGATRACLLGPAAVDWDAVEPPVLVDALCMPQPPKQVSKCACEYVSLLLGVMADSLAQEGTCAAIAASLRLYTALRTARSDVRSVAYVPAIAALLYSDAVFLSGMCCSWALRGDVRATGARHIVQAATDLLRRASTAWHQQLETRRNELDEDLACVHDGLRSVGESPEWQAGAERAVKRTRHHLGIAARAWVDVLAPHTLHGALGMLADHVLGHVVDAIAGLDDISVDDGVVLESLCSTLLGALGDGSAHWFVHARMVTKEDLVTSSRDTGVTTLDRGLSKHVPHWGHLKCLRFILTAKMVHIVDQWETGLLYGFDAVRLQHMIQALFSESPLRQQQLARLQ